MPEQRRAEATFDDFVAAALPALLRFGHVLTGNPHDAEDLVQEALARSMRKWRRDRPPASRGHAGRSDGADESG